MTPSATVYIVDDEADYRFILQQVFTRFLPNYPARFFASGQDLLKSLEVASERPNLILMDLDMPGLNGYDLLNILKQHPQWKSVPVVVMTSSTSPEDVNSCYAKGANSFLKKPIDINLMRQAMETICQYWLELNRPVPAPVNYPST